MCCLVDSKRSRAVDEPRTTEGWIAVGDVGLDGPASPGSPLVKRTLLLICIKEKLEDLYAA